MFNFWGIFYFSRQCHILKIYDKFNGVKMQLFKEENIMCFHLYMKRWGSIFSKKENGILSIPWHPKIDSSPQSKQQMRGRKKRGDKTVPRFRGQTQNQNIIYLWRDWSTTFKVKKVEDFFLLGHYCALNALFLAITA